MNEPSIILGTAGHIDHGKTALVKALTGIDTDVHKEEKERGITIDIGFAPFPLPDGRRIGVIDVPGHERFIKNMLAGASGIDLILLVIDANEGIMPQTVEHLQILQLLHVQRGIIVLTKVDTVDAEWLLLVEEEVRQGLKDTFLADAPILPVSAHKGTGIEALRAEIGRLAADVLPREVTAPLRLPIDRVFSVAGFGTVVTGTVMAGVVQVGDAVEVLPEQMPARVRSIQVHGESKERAQAGQRAAMNLVGVERAELARGMVVAQPGLFQPTELIDVRLHLLPDSPRALTNRMRIRFYIGASEVLGRVSILEGNELLPGSDSLVQIQLESPIVCLPQDRFIIRSYSPMLTMGGGQIIDPYPSRLHRRRREWILDELRHKEQGGPEQLVLQVLVEQPGLTLSGIAAAAKVTAEVAEQWVTPLVEQELVVHLPELGGYVSRDWLERALDEMEEKMRAHLTKAKYHTTVAKAQVLSQFSQKLRPKLFDALLTTKDATHRFVVVRDKIALCGYEVPFTLRDKELLAKIEPAFREAGFKPQSAEELRLALNAFEKTWQGLLFYLKEQGILVEVEEGLYLHRDVMERAKETIRERFAETGPFSVGDFRDWVGTSRKYAVAILEYLDTQKFSKRVDDKRVLVKPRHF